MRLRLPRLPPLVYGWPRRAAAALCFALALLTSFSSAGSRATPNQSAVPPGLVATSATVSADAASFVRRGDRVDLVETVDTTDVAAASRSPTVIARDVRVLDVRVPTDVTGGGRTAHLLVAAPRGVAVAIAAHQGGRVLAAITAPP